MIMDIYLNRGVKMQKANTLSCHNCGAELIKDRSINAYSYKVYKCPSCKNVKIRIDTGYRYTG